MVYKTRERLIEVARQLFVHKGLENTTMNDIANASQKGRRTIYTYFKNKKEIYNAVLEHESDLIVASMKELAESNLAPDIKLSRFLSLKFEQDRLKTSPYSTLKFLFKFDLRKMNRIRQIVLNKESLLLNQILDEGIEKGYFDPERAHKANNFLLNCISKIAMAENIDTEGADSELPLFQSSFVEFVVSDLSYAYYNKQSY